MRVGLVVFAWGIGMKRDRNKSLFKRFSRTEAQTPALADGALPDRPSVLAQQGTGPQTSLKGEGLEQAYRELLVEVQMLRQHNLEMGVALEKQHLEQEDSSASEQLIRAQRNALAERSRRLRETEYENKKLLREHKKLAEDNRKLYLQLERHVKELHLLQQQHQNCQVALRDTRAALQGKESELLAFADRYRQLESAIEKFSVPHGSVVNG
jgi:hypothetical protein